MENEKRSGSGQSVFLFLEIKEFTERTEKIKRRKKILKF